MRYMLIRQFRTLKRGQQRLLIHRGVEADARTDTTTPSELPEQVDEMGRLERVRPASRMHSVL